MALTNGLWHSTTPILEGKLWRNAHQEGWRAKSLLFIQHAVKSPSAFPRTRWDSIRGVNVPLCIFLGAGAQDSSSGGSSGFRQRPQPPIRHHLRGIYGIGALGITTI